MLETQPRVDAVFAVNDPAAIGAMKAIWEAGLRVPEDIAVVGAGDVAYSDLIRVPLTTVRWSKGDVGRRAAELILDQISGGDEEVRPRRVIIPPEIVVRASA
jgi:LacI family transcriptional regulator